MEFQIKKFKSFRGMEGMGFNLELWVDGAKACFIVARPRIVRYLRRSLDSIDEANGGMFRYEWASRKAAQKVQAHVDALPIIPSISGVDKSLWPEGRKQDMDEFISHLVDEFESDKRFKRLCKTKTVFRLPTDKAGDYRSLNVPYPAGRQYVLERHSTAEFLNEKYL